MSSDEAWTRLAPARRPLGPDGLGPVRRRRERPAASSAKPASAISPRAGQHYDGVPEAAWTIAPWAQGHGYATEATGRRWPGSKRLGAERSVCLIHVDNAASRRVADKLGYKAFAECTYRGYDALLFERKQAPLND